MALVADKKRSSIALIHNLARPAMPGLGLSVTVPSAIGSWPSSPDAAPSSVQFEVRAACAIRAFFVTASTWNVSAQYRAAFYKGGSDLRAQSFDGQIGNRPNLGSMRSEQPASPRVAATKNQLDFLAKLRGALEHP
jgi:hypothetical protein